MKRKYNELYIGLSVIITVAAVIATILFLEKNNFLQSGITINMVVQNAQGIDAGGNVFYKGLNVGSVEGTDIVPRGIVLKLKITRIDSIPDDSRFIITTSSFIGGKAIEIQGGKSNSYLKNGSYINGETTAGFSDIMRGVDNVTTGINKMVNNVQDLTNAETRKKLNDALTEIDRSVGLIHRSLQSNLDDINKTIKNIKDITTDNKGPIDSTVSRLSGYTKSLGLAVENLNQISLNLKDITERINKGEGTAGKLLTSDELYNKINSTVTNLNSLISDIKAHPERYVRVTLF